MRLNSNPLQAASIRTASLYCVDNFFLVVNKAEQIKKEWLNTVYWLTFIDVQAWCLCSIKHGPLYVEHIQKDWCVIWKKLSVFAIITDVKFYDQRRRSVSIRRNKFCQKTSSKKLKYCCMVSFSAKVAMLKYCLATEWCMCLC